jgi:hypothetical protein
MTQLSCKIICQLHIHLNIRFFSHGHFIFLIIVVLGGVHWSIYKGSYNVSNISFLNSPTLLLYFIFPLPISETISTGIIFALTYMCIQYLCHHSLFLWQSWSKVVSQEKQRLCICTIVCTVILMTVLCILV